MKYLKYGSLSLLLVLLANSAIAQPATGNNVLSTHSGKNCLYHSKTQLQMNKCTQQLAMTEKAKMQALLKKIKTKMTTAQYAELASLQTQWHQFVRKQCYWEMKQQYSNGSLGATAFNFCLRRYIKTRIAALKPILCIENTHDINCQMG